MSVKISKIKPFNFGGTVAVISILAILAKAAGFAEKMVIAKYFGTGASADIYFAATGLLLSFAFLIKELVHPTFLPVFSKTLKDNPENSAALFRKFMLICIPVIVVIGIAVLIFSEPAVRLFMPGFSPEKKQYASATLKLLSPAFIFLSLSMITCTTLNAHRKFISAAIPETAYKFLILLGFFLLIPLFDLKAVPLVLSLASAILFTAMLLFIPEHKGLCKLSADVPTKISKVFLLMGPIALGVIFSHISGLVDNILASTLPTGHLSYLGYSKKIIDALLLIGPVALVTVSYAQLSNISHDKDRFLILFVKVLRVLIFIAIPATVLIVFLRGPIVQILFERGKFDYDSAVGTSHALLYYGLGFSTFALEAHFVYSFYALSNTRTPVTVGIICVILDIILAVSLIRPLGYLGIAMAFVISKTIKVVILAWLFQKRFSFIKDHGIFSFIIKTGLAVIPSTALLYYLCGFNSNGNLIAKGTINLIMPSIGFITSYAAISLLLKIEEARYVLKMVSSRLGLRKEASQNE